MTFSLNKCQIHSDSVEKIITTIKQNQSRASFGKNKETFHIDQSVSHTVIFNLQ